MLNKNGWDVVMSLEKNSLIQIPIKYLLSFCAKNMIFLHVKIFLSLSLCMKRLSLLWYITNHHC